MDWRYRIATLLLCVQLLLALHTYRSTDFEVHRNWLAITFSLPISRWYHEATSEWTLDYPPIFAWFEWAMARAALAFDPAMLVVENLNYASPATVLFQRLSVCITNLVLVAAMLKATESSKSTSKGITTFALVVCNAGLVMVDNIHFQYNGILMGILVFSITCVEQQRYVLGGALFALLLNMKHLFAYLAPLYFTFLLKHYVLAAPHSNSRSSNTGSSAFSSPATATGASTRLLTSLTRLLSMGGVVLAVCAVSFGPFIAMGQLQQVMSRLFPFARGLCHAYWAPNAWALYSFVDKGVAAVAVKAGLMQPAVSANMAGGVVGISSYVVLPNIGAAATAVLVLVAMVPCLVAVWRASDQEALALFAPAVAYANLCGFMFGYHVHEKAALTVEIPMALMAARASDWGQQYVLLSTAAHVGIFPLLFQVQEIPIRWLLAAVYYIICVWGLASTHMKQQGSCTHDITRGTAAVAAGIAQSRAAAEVVGKGSGARTRRQLAQEQQQQAQPLPATPSTTASRPYDVQQGTALDMHECCCWLPGPHRLYLAGFVALELYCVLGHQAVFGDRLPFVPLMLTSVYCAVGVTWVWGWTAWWFTRRCCAI